MNEKALMRKTKAELLKILKACGEKADPKSLKKDLVKLILKSEPAPKKASKKKPKPKAPKTQTTTRRKKPTKKLPVAAASTITEDVSPLDAGSRPRNRDIKVQRPAGIPSYEAPPHPQPREPYAGRHEQPTAATRPAELSRRYGEDRITAMVRDPYWIFAYWEVTPHGLERARRKLAGEDAPVVLRVYDVGGIEFTGENANNSRDIEVGAKTDNWYINTGSPGNTYCVDIGLLARDGSFSTIARSQCVSTPRATPSDKVDDRWMSPEGEFEQVYALSGGFDTGAASPELHELMERQLQARISS